MLCLHNIQTNERVFDHDLTDAKLREVTRTALIAEADWQARADCDARRDEDWARCLATHAAKVLQRLFQGWLTRRRLGFLRARADKDRRLREQVALGKKAAVLQGWARGMAKRAELRAVVAKAFAKKKVAPGKGAGVGAPNEAPKVVYVQLNETCTLTYDHRPYLHRRYFPGIEW